MARRGSRELSDIDMTIGPAIPLDVIVAKIVAGSKALVSPLASSVSLPTRRIDGACSLPAGLGLLAGAAGSAG